MKLFIFLFAVLFVVAVTLKQDKFFNDDPEMADSNRTPVVNIHMEDHDSDPINFRRFDGERKTYSIRGNELRERYENEKKALIKVITLQQSKIEHLAEIADATNRILEFKTRKPADKQYTSLN